MRTFLTFDISIKNTGWASGAIDATPRSGSFALNVESQKLGPLLNKFSRHARDLIILEKPDFIGIEAPFVHGKGLDVARALICMAGEVERVAYEISGIRAFDVHQATLKTFFTGDQYASKEKMIARCGDFGWDPKNDDEADALAIWLYGVDYFFPRAVADIRLQADMGGVR